MKKIYETPELEISKFTLAADILTESEQEGNLESKDDNFGSGWGWG